MISGYETGQGGRISRDHSLANQRSRVTAVRSVELAVVDLDAAQDFFTRVWGLEKNAAQDGVVYLRANGPHFHVLSLREARGSAVIRIVLEAADRFGVDLLCERIQQYGCATDGPPRALTIPGGGYGFGFRDSEGRGFAVVCDVADRDRLEPAADRPTRLSHVNLNCRDNDAAFQFMTTVLGFCLSDRTPQFRFIRCNEDHHSLVLGFNDNCFLNHIAFELPDLDSVMRGIGRMRDFGYAVEWGPGRHGPGNNVFAYFCGPEEVPIEYTSEMQQVSDNYRVRSPKDWAWPPGRLDQWGITCGPSARVKNAQSRFSFLPEGYKLEL